MHPSVRDIWHEFNTPIEARVEYMYLDRAYFVSTAVGIKIDESPFTPAGQMPAPISAATRAKGHALAQRFDWRTRDGTVASAQDVADEWDRTKSRTDLAPLGGGHFAGLGQLHLEDSEIDRMVLQRLDEMEADLCSQAEFVSFQSWPADAQLGLLSMAWGMGPRFGFPMFRGCIVASDWNGASLQCRFKPDEGTITLRNDRNQQLFRNAAAVVSGGLDPTTLIYPNTL